jgi:hypothetical protein
MEDRVFPNNTERKITIACLYSDEFLRRMFHNISTKYFTAKYSKKLVSLSILHYRRYQCAPKGDIDRILVSQKDKEKIDEEDYYILSTFIEDVQTEKHELESVESMVEEAKQFFVNRQLIEKAEEIMGLVEAGETEEAYRAAQAQICDFAEDEGIDPFTNTEAIKRAYTESSDPILTYEGALGHNLNKVFLPGALVGILAPEKRGKSWFLIDMCLRAMKQGKKVAMFQAGDMTEKQVLRRIGTAISKKSHVQRYCGESLIPVSDCRLNQLCTCENPMRACDREDSVLLDELSFAEKMKIVREATEDGYRPCTHCFENSPYTFDHSIWYEYVPQRNAMTDKEAMIRGVQWKKKYKGDMRISIHSTNTLTVSHMRAILNTWERNQGFIPDLIVVDYADILAPDDRRLDFRNQVNSIWMALRQLSQDDRGWCVVAPTQSNADSYRKSSLGMWNFSEDKRKLSHVTAFIGINQTKEEKRQGLIRYSLFMSREDDVEVKQAVVMQHLSTGQAVCGSFFWEGKDEEEDGKKKKMVKEDFEEE